MAEEIKTSPIDANDIRPCSFCKRGVMHTGSPVFYEVSISSCIADAKNIQTLHGMEMLLGGNGPIARAMSPTTTIAHRIPPTRHFLCATCAMDEQIIPISLMEQTHV